MYANLMNTMAPFDFEYRVIYASHSSPWQTQIEFILETAVSIVNNSLINV